MELDRDSVSKGLRDAGMSQCSLGLLEGEFLAPVMEGESIRMSRSRAIRAARGIGSTLAALAVAGCPPAPARTQHVPPRPIGAVRRAVSVPPGPDADVSAELPAFLVPSTAMAGPFPSVSTYCTNTGVRPSGYQCLPAPNRWDDGSRSGARGPQP